MDAHDNMPGGLKPLVDAIAESLGLDDVNIEVNMYQIQIPFFWRQFKTVLIEHIEADIPD